MSNVDNSISDGLEPLLLELGKALFVCQMFEDSLCMLHAQLSHEESQGEQGAFRASWDFHSSKPLGPLLIALRKRIDIPADLDVFFDSGVKIRNRIVHGFMGKNIQRLADPKSRLEVEAELSSLKLEVRQRDVAVNKILDSLFAKYGFSNADLKRAAGDNWEYMNKPLPIPTQ